MLYLPMVVGQLQITPLIIAAQVKHFMYYPLVGWFVCSHLSKNSVNTAVAFTHCQRARIAAAEEEDGGTPPAAQPSVLNLDPSSYRFVAGTNP